MIKLNQLLKEETFTATNKATGKTSVFKTKDSRDAAIKAGTHNPIKDTEQPSAPKAAGSDMFGGDYAKDRGGEAGKEETPKYDLGVDSVVYNKRTNTIGIVRMGDERGETKTDADGNVNTSELEPYNPMKYPHQKDAQVAPSTSKEIETRSLWKPFSQSNQPTQSTDKSKPSVSLKTDEDGYMSFDSAMSLEKFLNKELGANGSADVNDNGAIEYTIPTEDGDWDNALYVGRENGKWIVSIESNGGTDNKFGDDWYKTFDKAKDAINHAMMIAKKYKKELGGETTNEGIIRLTKLMENDPCWKGYKQVGMKDKNGREVPNCVPESVVKEAGIPKLYLKIEAVKNKIKALEAERKSKYGGEYARKLNAETDPKKKHELAQPIFAITKQITMYQKNLLKMMDDEEKYYANMGKDDELDPNFA